MAGLVRASIGFVLANYSLTFFVIGLVISAFAIARAAPPLSAAVIIEKLLSWHIFFAVGVYFLYNFIMHVFFGRMSADFILLGHCPATVRPHAALFAEELSQRRTFTRDDVTVG